jgi:hypothetical protein
VKFVDRAPWEIRNRMKRRAAEATGALRLAYQGDLMVGGVEWKMK